MHQDVGDGMELDLAGQHPIALAIDLEIQQPVGEAALFELVAELASVDGNVDRLSLAAIDHGRDAARAARGAGGTSARLLAQFRGQNDYVGHCRHPLFPAASHHRACSSSGATSVRGLRAARARRYRPAPAQSKRLETERSSLMRRIASAIRGAIDMRRMLWDTRTASVVEMLSVVTRVSSAELATRATAPPESTA